MQDRPRGLLLCLVAGFAFGACGSGSDTPAGDLDASAGSSVCGTYDHPGILKVTGLSPATGATVINQSIVHRFTVENAPAVFSSFTLNYGSKHTAGGSTPSEPKLQHTLSGNTMIYQLAVDTWSRAPGHVELVASNGYQTSKGCFWEFPSPLFSYDITPVLDGGAGEANGAFDGGGTSVDSPHDVEGSLDAALDAAGALDAATEIDVPLAFDGPAAAEVSAAPDGGVPAIDVAPSVDAGLD
jgi:hypothetical protein